MIDMSLKIHLPDSCFGIVFLLKSESPDFENVEERWCVTIFTSLFPKKQASEKQITQRDDHRPPHWTTDN